MWSIEGGELPFLVIGFMPGDDFHHTGVARQVLYQNAP
jgi:hypothetical protein